MTDPTPDVEPAAAEIEVETDDGDEGALAALEMSHYRAAHGDPHPIAEAAE